MVVVIGLVVLAAVADYFAWAATVDDPFWGTVTGTAFFLLLVLAVMAGAALLMRSVVRRRRR
jgi:DMSO/TMAO reductase YedYZ heme-binding membrane subunit